MKKSFFLLIASVLFLSSSFAQESNSDGRNEDHRAWKLNNLFAGGSIGLGAGSGTFALGANPEIGYSFSNIFDAGILFNVNYYSLSAGANNGDQQRNFNFGSGAFVRAWIFNGFFIQAQPEYNWITQNDNVSGLNYVTKYGASSFLAGAGWGSRDIGNFNFFTVIMADLGNDPNSPYKDYYGDIIPVIRAGVNFYFH